jgi:DNA-binding transcriptional ArsR family regulator
MLAYVPVNFDLYRALKPHLRWTLQCLVRFADRTGRCFPSVRKLGEVADISKSTAARHLSQLEKAGALTRRRRPGRGYLYQIDSRFLPAARKTARPLAGVSHQRERAVPPSAGIEEKPTKNTSYALPDSWIPDVRSQWAARTRAFKESGFWLPQWGPKPNQPGCFAPVG